MISRNIEPLSADQLYQYALRLLTGRDYTSTGLRSKLASRNMSEEDVEATILRLQGEGWMDDRRYAERFAESAISAGRLAAVSTKPSVYKKG